MLLRVLVLLFLFLHNLTANDLQKYGEADHEIILLHELYLLLEDFLAIDLRLVPPFPAQQIVDDVCRV